MPRFKVEGGAARPEVRLTPRNDAGERGAKSLVIEVLNYGLMERAKLRAEQVLADPLSTGSQTREAIGVVAHRAMQYERSGSDRSWYLAMTNANMPRERVLNVWDRKHEVDFRTRGVGEERMPDAAAKPREYGQGPVHGNRLMVTSREGGPDDAKRSVSEPRLSPQLGREGSAYSGSETNGGSPQDINTLSRLTNPANIAAGLIGEVFLAGDRIAVHADRLAEPFRGTQAEDVIRESKYDGEAYSNGQWVRALVEDGIVPVEDVERIVEKQFESVDASLARAPDDLSSERLQRIAEPFRGTQAEKAIDVSHVDGVSIGDENWLTGLTNYDGLTVSDLNRLADRRFHPGSISPIYVAARIAPKK